MKRRSFAVLLAAPLWGGCAPRDRAAVLEGLVREVVAEMARDLTRQTRALHEAVTEHWQRPGATSRALLRQRFTSAALAWKRAQAFRSGPFVSSQAFQRAAFWPASAAAIDNALAAPVVDEQLVEGLGVDARGLWALEYALFERDATLDEKRRRYARELSVNILGYAERLSRKLGDAQSFAREFGAAGEHSVTTLAAQSQDTLEIVRGKLERVERAVSGGTALELAVEGYYSHSSTANLRALVVGAEGLYSGGLQELAARVAPDVARRTRDSFVRLQERILTLEPELEIAVRTQPGQFRAVKDALAELQHTYEVELRSALEA